MQACLFVALTAVSAAAQAPAEGSIEPDRPDVTNGTHIVDTGLLQLEIGTVFGRPVTTERTFASPLTARIGLLDWLEARIGTDGLLVDAVSGTRAAGIGNVQLGAKLRLWSSPGGVPVLSILPTVNLPTASARKGLGSGVADYTLAVLTGTDLGRHGHVDVNYGIGSLGAGGGQPRFAQHLYAVSASYAVSDNWNPYAEAFWISRQEPSGGASTAVDVGAIYELGTRLALDGGLQFGVAGHAPNFVAFGGLSIIVGNLLGNHGVHARERRARERAGRKAARPSAR